MELKLRSRNTGFLRMTAIAAGIVASMGAAPLVARAIEIGHAAPAFTLTNVASGQKTSLSTLKQGKKATVLMFIATRCPVSNAYNARMVDLAKKYSAQGIAFVGINSNETEPVAECAEHATTNGFPFPVLKDAGDVVADKYDAHVTPETFVIDAKGVVVYHGRIDNSRDIGDVTTHELADALDSVIAGKAVAKSETKAFGCGIKRG